MAYGRRFGNRERGSPREMHKAVCSNCGNECEVPFKPEEGRLVYCKECFRKHRSRRRSLHWLGGRGLATVAS